MIAMKRFLIIDRDGVILQEPPGDYQVDSVAKTAFVPGAITALAQIAARFDYYKILFSNQDGLGTPLFPEETFTPYQDLMIRTLEGEGFRFDETLVDRSFEHEALPSRKPGIALLQHLFDGTFDLAGSFVIGDRWSDMQLAKNLGCKGILLQALHELTWEQGEALKETIVFRSTSWKAITQFLEQGTRTVSHTRVTSETNVSISLNLEGDGRSTITTGLGFFDHMLDQLARHGGLDLSVNTRGDLHVDEHHTIEDTGIALGEAFAKAMKNKAGMERYGFALPMDDASAQVLVDFGGRNWIVWDAVFQRERIGDVPTEMFFHFFKSFSDGARCNLNIRCQGNNEHHMIESIFKAFARAMKMAVRRDPFSNYLPSTKGVI